MIQIFEKGSVIYTLPVSLWISSLYLTITPNKIVEGSGEGNQIHGSAFRQTYITRPAPQTCISAFPEKNIYVGRMHS